MQSHDCAAQASGAFGGPPLFRPNPQHPVVHTSPMFSQPSAQTLRPSLPPQPSSPTRRPGLRPSPPPNPHPDPNLRPNSPAQPSALSLLPQPSSQPSAPALLPVPTLVLIPALLPHLCPSASAPTLRPNSQWVLMPTMRFFSHAEGSRASLSTFLRPVIQGMPPVDGQGLPGDPGLEAKLARQAVLRLEILGFEAPASRRVADARKALQR